MGLREEDPDLYAIAKQRVLGLQYGMGAKAFAEVCRKAGLLTPIGWRKHLSACMEATPGRARLFTMLNELERAGVKITVTEEDELMMRLGKSGTVEHVNQIFARHLPPTLKVIERPSGGFEIVPASSG